MKTQILDLNKPRLWALTDTDKTSINGGGFWAIYEIVGYTVGLVVGVTLNVAKETASKLLK